MMSILAVKNGFMSHLCHNFSPDLPALKSLSRGFDGLNPSVFRPFASATPQNPSPSQYALSESRLSEL